jgi:thiol:disulfide interchange protein DsbG
MPRVALVVVFAFLSSLAFAAERRNATPASALFSQLEKADAVVEGARDSRHLLYVFFDANCYYCHLTWKALQPYEAVGLQVRWVPVAYQQPSSVGRAAAIMESTDRVAALRQNETGYDRAHFDGAIAPLPKTSPARVKSLEANTKLMRAFGAPGTPAVVWKNGEDNVRFRAGVPRLSELAAMTGLPAQPNDDPELAQFR